MGSDTSEHFVKIVLADRRYTLEAYEFILETLAFAQKHFRKEKHVSGAELVFAAKELSVRKFGPLAISIFCRWGVSTPLDIGHIVFNMIDHGLLCRSNEDVLEDFIIDYDLFGECRQAYQLHLERVVRRLR